MNKLESWLASQWHGTKCIPLPLAHITSWSSFVQVARAGRLIAQSCPVFKEEILYLSYGSVAYKPSKKAYSWADDAPVLMIFAPSIMRRVSRFFPFDTGAIAAGRFEDNYLTTVNDFRLNCSIRVTARTAPWHWINIAFGSNSQYFARKGELLHSSKEDMLIVIAQMQKHFKTGDRTDHRLIAIECHIKDDVPLNDVLWLGAPTDKRDELTALFQRTRNSLPPVFWYNQSVESGALPNDLRSKAEEFFLQSSLTSEVGHVSR